MTPAETIPAILLYYDGDPRRLVRVETTTAPWMVDEAMHAARTLATGRAVLVLPVDEAAVLDEVAAQRVS